MRSAESATTLDPARERRAARRAWLAAIAIVAASFTVYAPSYRYDPARHEGFVWDDDDHFLNDPLIRAGDGWWRIWADPQPGVVGAEGGAVVWNYWPLTRTSFWLDRHLWGTDARGLPDLVAARLTNVALHAANALLLMLVLRNLRVPGAELAALLFAVHPVAVESVAWITERKALLSTALFLATLLAWRRFEATAARRWYLVTALAFVATLMAKTSTVMLPVLLAGLQWYERRPWTARSVARLAPLFAMSAIAGVTSIVFERFFIGSQGALFATSLAERTATAGWIVWFYLAHAIAPAGVSFNYPRFEVDAASWLHWVPSLALLGCAALLWRWRERGARPWLLALGAFVANLFPVMGFFGVYGMRYAHVADHWLYLAMTSVVALAAALATTLLRRVVRARPRLAPAATALGIAAACVVVAWLGVQSHRYAGAFVDRESLWRHTLAAHPGSFLANNNLGVSRLAERRYDEAIAHFRRATESEPGFAEGWVNAGNALDASGRTAEAVPYWERAVAIDPRQSIALYNLAVARIQAGELDDAESFALRALDVDPRDPRALQALQYVYEQQGRPAALDPLLAGAQRVETVDRAARGRSVARAIWAAFALALAGCVAVCASEPRAPRRSRST